MLAHMRDRLRGKQASVRTFLYDALLRELSPTKNTTATVEYSAIIITYGIKFDKGCEGCMKIT